MNKKDEEIRGIINIMEELKQQNKVLARGDKSFSIKRSWLEKLEKEGAEANKEFWYLKFSYGDEDPKIFVVLDADMLDSMVYTMISDRRAVKDIEKRIKVIEKREQLNNAKALVDKQRIEYLEALLDSNDIEYDK